MIFSISTLILSGSAPIYAQNGLVVGNPNIDVLSPENRVDLGEKTSLDIFLNNKGNINIGGPIEFEKEVTTARATIVELKKGNAPIEIKTAKKPVGNIQEGINGPYSFTIEIKQNGKPGRYRIPLDIEYKHTRLIRHGEDFLTTRTTSTKTITKYITLIIEEKPQFQIIDSSSNVTIGDTGTAKIKIKNNGFQTAYNSTVIARSEDIQLMLGEESSASSGFNTLQDELFSRNFTQISTTYIGNWREGETKTLEYMFSLRDNALVRNYPVEIRVKYENRNGIMEISDTLVTGIYPNPRASFKLTNTYSSLNIGNEGRLGGTIVNNGETIITDTVLVLDPPKSFSFERKEFPIGDLEPENPEKFNFTIYTPKTKDIGPNKFNLYLEHKNSQGETIKSKSVNLIGNIEPKKNNFILDTYNPRFEVDSEDTLLVNVTNNRNEKFRDIVFNLIVDSETITSDDNSGFIQKLNSNQNGSVSFHLDISDDAIAKKTPIPIYVEYEDQKGVRKNDTYYISINVLERPGTGLPIIEIVLVLIVVSIGIFWWWKREKNKN